MRRIPAIDGVMVSMSDNEIGAVNRFEHSETYRSGYEWTVTVEAVVSVALWRREPRRAAVAK